MALRFCGMGNQLVPDHRNFDTKNVRHSVTIKQGSEVIDMIRLDMPNVLFVSKEIEDPVKRRRCDCGSFYSSHSSPICLAAARR